MSPNIKWSLLPYENEYDFVEVIRFNRSNTIEVI